MSDTDLVIVEETDSRITLRFCGEQFKISRYPDDSWEPVMDRTWMNQKQLTVWLKDNMKVARVA